MTIIHKLEMEMAQRGTVQWIDAVQGDCNTRELELTLLCNGESWAVPETAVARMRYCKSDGTKGVYDTLPDGSCAWRAEDNRLTVALAPQMLTVPGIVTAQAVLVDGTAELASFALQIQVERNPAADALESEDYVNMAQWLEAEVERLLLQAKENGELNGTGVYDYAVSQGFEGDEKAFAEQLLTPCLPLAGGVMAGSINMGGQALSGLTTPVNASDAVTKSYLDQKVARAILTVSADGWSGDGPYTQTVKSTVIRATDWPRIDGAYTGVEATDREIRLAMECVDYVMPYNGSLCIWCLDKKPETDFNLFVELVR